MHDPIAIERCFQNLLSFLAYPVSARQRLNEVNKFLDWLGDDLAAHESYVLELAQQWPDLVDALNGAGCSPESLQAFWEKLRRLHAELPALASINGLDEAIKKLQNLVACLHAYAGDIATCLAFLDARFAANPPDWLAELSNGHPIHPRALMQQVREQAQSHKEEITDILDWMIAQWSPAFKADGESTVVPVIERSLVGATGDAGEGGLRRLTMKILGTSREGRDEIDTDVRVIGAPQAAANVIQVPIMAARRLLLESHLKGAQKFFTGKIAFEAAPVLHEGNSANLAIAALFYCAVLRHTDQRLQYRLAVHVAMTGDLNEKGEILPVDQVTLGVKVKAAFFSWVECLVVPRSQLGEAETTIQELRKRYPHRHLTIIGAGHLQEIFYDRRLTMRQRAGIAKHLARKAWRQKFTVGGLAVIALLLLIIGKLLYGPIDMNPVAAEFVEESLLVKNKYGDILDEIYIGVPTVISVTATRLHPGPQIVAFYDLDGDGCNEIIWGQGAIDQNKHSSFVYCKSLRKDSLFWSVPLRRTLDFPRNPDVTSDYFFPYNILAGDLDADGEPEVYVNALHNFFPAMVLKLEAKTGQELGHYIHLGHLNAMRGFDLNQDGITEILLGGTNNAYNQACLVVLDPRFLQGHSPTTGDYVLDGYTIGLERTYLLIPSTIVGEALQGIQKRNLAQSIQIQGSTFFVDLLDVTPISDEKKSCFEVDQANLLAYFDFDLSIKNFGTADNYDLMARQLFRDRKISRLPDYAYFESFKKEIRYWDGEGWRHEVVINKRYVEACKTQ